MEKQGKPKNKILKFLPRAASAVAASFQNPTFSPGRDRRSEVNTNRHKANRGFSGPIISIIPDEARRKSSKNGGFETQEPTSPKVSCMGQVRFSNKKRRTKPIKRVISLPTQLATVQVSCPKDEVKIKKPPEITKGPKEGRKSDIFYDDTMVTKKAVPSLGKIKRFSSARGALSNFDWRIHDAVVVPDCQDG